MLSQIWTELKCTASGAHELPEQLRTQGEKRKAGSEAVTVVSPPPLGVSGVPESKLVDWAECN